MEESPVKQQPDAPVVPLSSEEVLFYAIPVAVPAQEPHLKEAPALAQAPEGAIKTGEWDADLCGCCTHCVPNCCMSFLCPCVSLAQISSRLGIAPYECSLITFIVLVCLSGGLAQAFFFIWIWQARYVTRQRFSIPGNCCSDCCVSICCSSCALAQMATHIKSYKPGSCDFGPPDTLPGYIV